ncbi:unnamed protein product [Adineta steineri]|uniref:Uncharacterized protein n=1 Tax=Adineta steineri TaxID=433720 RepID=A0A815K080_9BILA|nr:unnamed protein product [Adineta steineri]CAF1388682.1 unnamed protein product [Adineta steineri]
MSNLLSEDKSLLQHSTQKSEPAYIKFDQMSDTKNIRSRYNKFNTSAEIAANPAHYVLSTGDFNPNEKENDARLISRNKHDTTQIIFMVFTALAYLLHTLRAYIPETIQTNSQFWSYLAIRPITRVYTSDIRPSIVIESLLYRLAENWQAFWLIYVLSYIPRRTHIGFLYRNPNIFNSFLCFLLISALSFQTLSQSSLSAEISCVCLILSLCLLVVTCRLTAVNLLKYEEKYKAAGLSFDLIILRYFVLNSLFLYTTSVAYSTTCAIIEYIGIHLDPNTVSPTFTSICTTIGLTIMLFLLFIYYLLDQFVYKDEFRSIWTPYLFIGYIFIYPPLRQLSLLDTDVNSNNLNYYLFWIFCTITILMICIRLYQQISVKCKRSKKKIRISSHIDQVTT